MSSKKIKYSYTEEHKHWVGDGFNVYGLLRPSQELNRYISPFILMDYAEPREFPPSQTPKGVGVHPHRGFETVTFAYQGEVEHRDSSGGGGIIKAGDVQWMTAGSGVVHDEFHSKEFTKQGGTFEMVQLWVNLPKKFKMTAPKYQSIQSKDIPVLEIAKHTTLRVIAGRYNKTKGPASTFSPINMYDLISKEEEELKISLPESTNTVLLVLRGELEINNKSFTEKSILIFEQEGESISIKTSKDFKALILNGEPINEPMIASGPFVMNTRQEILQAYEDYQNGKMGTL